MAEHVFRIINDGQGMGCFLCPPGDPKHRYFIREMSSSRWNAYEVGAYALDTEAQWVPEGIRRMAARMLGQAQRVESPAWVAHVYGYFRNMYAPEGQPWTTANGLLPGKPGEYPDDWHAGAVAVRRYFPEHVTRADLIRDPGRGYGSYPCVHCGERVQYEARVDALVIYPGTVACTASDLGHATVS